MKIDKPAPKGAKARKPAKRCYELAGKAVLEDQTTCLLLIHGAKLHERRLGGGWFAMPGFSIPATTRCSTVPISDGIGEPTIPASSACATRVSN